MAAALLPGAGAWLGRRWQVPSRAPGSPEPAATTLRLPENTTTAGKAGRRLMAADPGQPEGNKHSSVSFSSFRELLPSFGQHALPPSQQCPSSTGRWPPVASAQPPSPTSQRTKLKRGGTGQKAMCPEQLGLSGTHFYTVWTMPGRVQRDAGPMSGVAVDTGLRLSLLCGADLSRLC